MDEPHPELDELAFLIGSWEGPGKGDYPTVDGFEYRETATFAAPPGKPFLFYQQRTARAGDHPEAGSALHTEAGYVRPAGPGRAELVIAQPTGITEVLHGPIDGQSVHLRSATVATTDTAKRIDTTERILRVDGDVLSYELHMGAVGQPHQIHLRADLRRQA